jgi:hypothetical protein
MVNKSTNFSKEENHYSMISSFTNIEVIARFVDIVDHYELMICFVDIS